MKVTEKEAEGFIKTNVPKLFQMLPNKQLYPDSDLVTAIEMAANATMRGRQINILYLGNPGWGKTNKPAAIASSLGLEFLPITIPNVSVKTFMPTAAVVKESWEDERKKFKEGGEEKIRGRYQKFAEELYSETGSTDEMKTKLREFLPAWVETVINNAKNGRMTLIFFDEFTRSIVKEVQAALMAVMSDSLLPGAGYLRGCFFCMGTSNYTAPVLKQLEVPMLDRFSIVVFAEEDIENPDLKDFYLTDDSKGYNYAETLGADLVNELIAAEGEHQRQQGKKDVSRDTVMNSRNMETVFEMIISAFDLAKSRQDALNRIAKMFKSRRSDLYAIIAKSNPPAFKELAEVKTNIENKADARMAEKERQLQELIAEAKVMFESGELKGAKSMDLRSGTGVSTTWKGRTPKATEIAEEIEALPAGTKAMITQALMGK